MKQTDSLVWDPLVRIGHWLLAGAFVLAYASGDDLQPIHLYAGYTVFGVVLFRLIWGVIGTPHARFADFVRPWLVVREHLESVAKGSPKPTVGHNPAGGWMIVALLVSLLIATGSGMWLWSVGEETALGEMAEEIHEVFSNLTLLLVIIHVAGVLVESRLSRENLLKAMFTGRKPMIDETR